MSNQPHESVDDLRWQAAVEKYARAYAYPPMPDIAAQVRSRLPRRQPAPLRAWGRLAVAAALVIIVLGAVWSVPAVRAAVEQWLRLGAVTIVLDAPTPTIRALGEPLTSALQLPGETTLDAARDAIGAALRLPQYPADPGDPDHVYLYQTEVPLVTLVWTEADNPDDVRLVLQIIDSDGFATKFQPESVAETQVHGVTAYWAEDAHLLVFPSRDSTMYHELTRQVDDNVLIWQERGYTYRLETDLSLDEATRIAESLSTR